MRQITRAISLLILSIVSITNSAQELVKEERSLSPFSIIEVTKDIEVYVSEGDTSKVKIEADEYVLGSVITEVFGETLKITVDDRYKRLKFKNSTVRVHITIPMLKGILANTGSKVIALTKLNTDLMKVEVASNAEVLFNNKVTVAGKLDINANSSGKFTSKVKSSASKAFLTAMSKGELAIDLDIENDIECSAASNGKITVSGKATNAMFSATTHSELRLRGLEVQQANVVASTWSTIQVNVKEFLAATAANGATINYTGKPRSVSKETTTGGKIR